MSEVSTPVRTVRVDWYCDADGCAKLMRFTGFSDAGASPHRHHHECSSGHHSVLAAIYPLTRHEDILVTDLIGRF